MKTYWIIKRPGTLDLESPSFVYNYMENGEFF